jgi:hypothetical protein
MEKIKNYLERIDPAFIAMVLYALFIATIVYFSM